MTFMRFNKLSPSSELLDISLNSFNNKLRF